MWDKLELMIHKRIGFLKEQRTDSKTTQFSVPYSGDKGSPLNS